MPSLTNHKDTPQNLSTHINIIYCKNLKTILHNDGKCNFLNSQHLIAVLTIVIFKSKSKFQRKEIRYLSLFIAPQNESHNR